MLQFKKILCPVDFSGFSRSAFDRAVGIARLHRASVTALHVVPLFPPESLLPYPGAAGVVTYVPAAIDRAQLAGVLARFLESEAAGVPVTCEIGEAPDVAWEIVARADCLTADLIGMGTHGRSGFQRLLFGSVAEKVLRTARMPVLTVPAAVPEVVPIGAAPFRRILCATDFSPCAAAALDYAASLGEHPDTRVTVLHVAEITPPPYYAEGQHPTELAGLQRMLQESGREELHRSIPAAMQQACRIEEIVATGKPYREILRLAGELQSDLIVLGIHGRNPVDRLFFGSTTTPVVRRATCPVLTVRSEQGAAQAAA